MIKKDCHMHTAFSADSQSSPESMCEAAIRKGLTEICFTDHEEFGFDDPGFFRFDPEPYFEKMTAVKKAYEDRLKVRIGVEIGMIPDDSRYRAEIEALVRDYPWEYLIGSTHVFPLEINDVLSYVDPAAPDAPSRIWAAFPDTKELVRLFYEATLKNVTQYDFFDTVGHLDYISRYVPAFCKPYDYEDYEDLIDEILKVIISKDKALEINTAGLRKPQKRTNPEQRLIDRFLKLGGRKITYGSDAHVPEDVGYGFEQLTEY